MGGAEVQPSIHLIHPGWQWRCLWIPRTSANRFCGSGKQESSLPTAQTSLMSDLEAQGRTPSPSDTVRAHQPLHGPDPNLLLLLCFSVQPFLGSLPLFTQNSFRAGSVSRTRRLAVGSPCRELSVSTSRTRSRSSADIPWGLNSGRPPQTVPYSTNVPSIPPIFLSHPAPQQETAGLFS